MNSQISTVIICRNEAHIISKVIAAAFRFTDDVVVVDSGSTDGTQQIVSATGARLLETNWEGYGPNKNKGVAMAKYNWILSIDSDEIVDDTLAKQLQTLTLNDETVVYNILFRVFLGERMIRYGEWDNHWRGAQAWLHRAGTRY